LQSIDIYSPAIIRNYRLLALKRNAALPPHVFTVAQGAYHNLFHTSLNQSLIVCGESGSGKTESAKHLMRYLASSELEAKHSGDESDQKTAAPAVSGKVEKQVLDCNPILEAFGNAKTVLLGLSPSDLSSPLHSHALCCAVRF
jgi:myosin heavy subunit